MRKSAAYPSSFARAPPPALPFVSPPPPLLAPRFLVHPSACGARVPCTRLVDFFAGCAACTLSTLAALVNTRLGPPLDPFASASSPPCDNRASVTIRCERTGAKKNVNPLLLYVVHHCGTACVGAHFVPSPAKIAFILRHCYPYPCAFAFFLYFYDWDVFFFLLLNVLVYIIVVVRIRTTTIMMKCIFYTRPYPK